MNAKNFEDLTNKLDTIKDAVCSKSFFIIYLNLRVIYLKLLIRQQ